MSGRVMINQIRKTKTTPVEMPLLYSRSQAAKLLGGISVDSIIALEQQGKLSPVKLTGKPKSQVFYHRAELEALARGEAAE